MASSKVMMYQGGAWVPCFKVMQYRGGAWQTAKVWQYKGGAWVQILIP